jgi:integrase
MTLAYAGSRLSEALALTADRVDLAASVLVFESLKKRRTGIFRSVPIPPALLDTIDMVPAASWPQRLTAYVGPFDPGARGVVVLPELIRRLRPASGLQRFIVFARLKPDNPRLVLGP